ncbi:hypothetical protein [Neobacillus sp. PS2-9]|uniref:hypothetical protein n=1 Tax=Neobacillus sp. PS2-9 TaxID=3070676 RepID=UPI0027E02B14|nr:hypothetical protein [Neobacillus sp. PS2-9]WML58810.1 hypothetical protein RCG25_03155 [Neobacillus sp. PS2-9]
MQRVRMREIKTPFKVLGIRYFIGENGKYYRKIGANHRRSIIPLWTQKKFKVGMPLLLVLVLGFAGYKIGVNLASEKMVDEVAKQMPQEDIKNLLTDPNIQQMIENEVGEEKKDEFLNKYAVNTDENNVVSSSPVTTSNAGNQTSAVKTVQQPVTNNGNSQTNQQAPVKPKPKPKLKFNSREQVKKFLLTKFSMGELLGFADKAKGGLTPQVKAEIKAAVMQRLTAEEYEAIKVYALIELSRS